MEEMEGDSKKMEYQQQVGFLLFFTAVEFEPVVFFLSVS